jgi:hypothetical protein
VCRRRYIYRFNLSCLQQGAIAGSQINLSNKRYNGRKQFAKRVDRNWTIKLVALQEIDTDIAQKQGLLLGFHAFGNRLQFELSRQFGNGLDDLSRTDVADHLRNETAINLEDI